MNSVFTSPLPLPAPIRSTSLWLTTLGWFMACAASVTVAAAGMPSAGWARDVANPVPQAALLPAADIPGTAGAAAPEGLNALSSGRCRTCGIVEIVRTSQVPGAASVHYELTVRFRDGSRRISSHSDDAGWRAGDSIMIIGGTRLADRT